MHLCFRQTFDEQADLQQPKNVTVGIVLWHATSFSAHALPILLISLMATHRLWRSIVGHLHSTRGSIKNNKTIVEEWFRILLFWSPSHGPWEYIAKLWCVPAANPTWFSVRFCLTYGYKWSKPCEHISIWHKPTCCTRNGKGIVQVNFRRLLRSKTNRGNYIGKLWCAR